MKKRAELWISGDPRSKLLLALLFSVSAVLLNSIANLLLLFFLALLFCMLSRIAPAYLLKRSLVVNFFMAFVWLAVPWRLEFTGGQWNFIFHSDGLWLALAISLKCNAIFLAWMGLLWPTSLNHILQALASWHLSPKLLALFFLFCRFSQVLFHEYILLRQAMKARGFKPKLNLHTIKSEARLIATMLLRGFERAEVVYNAMLCRGFHGKFYFAADGLVWRKHDTLLLAGALSGIMLAALPNYCAGMFS